MISAPPSLKLPRFYTFYFACKSNSHVKVGQLSSFRVSLDNEILMLDTLIQSLPSNIPPITLVSNISVDSNVLPHHLRGRLEFEYFESDGQFPMYERVLAQKYIVEQLNSDSFPLVFMDSDMIFLDFFSFWSDILKLVESYSVTPALVLSARKESFPASAFNGGLMILFSRNASLKIYTQIANTYSLFVDSMKKWWGDQILLNVLDFERFSSCPVAIVPAQKFNYSPRLRFKNFPLISSLIICLQIFFASPYLLHLKGPLKFLYKRPLFAFLLSRYR